MYLKTILRIILVSAGVALCGCGDFESSESEVIPSSVNVVFAVGNTPRTRTEYDVETKRFVWNDGDKIAVWAKSPDGSYALDNQAFRLMAVASDKSEAYFTATLQSPMAEGTYSYYMTYPLPESMGGMTATFTVPSVQDGTASDGVDIIVAEPISGPALEPVKEAAPIVSDDVLNVRMRHLLHFLRFYIPEGNNLLGEPVKRIEFTMPRAVAGNVSVDVTDASTASLGDGVNGMTLELTKPIDASADGMESAVAGIFPSQTAYSAGDLMTVSIYSENKWASLSPMSLEGRTFAAGHLTPVPLRPAEVKRLYKLRFTLASNNLGEDPYNIRIALPAGVNWPGSASNVLGLDGTHNGLIKTGDTFIVETKDEAEFRALSSQPLTVSYESESALVTESLALGDLTSVSSAACSLNCPYLFFEDFSGVGDISSYDKHETSNPGSRKPETFLNGWSAARVGTMAGKSIRIACRRETSANYPARADSPFLSCLKMNHTVSLEVAFDYSMDRQNGGIGPVDVSQTMHIGYITTEESLKSGDDTGVYPASYTSDETGGSYLNVNKQYSVTLDNVSAPLRLSWRTTPENKAGLNNNTCWLYIDNIKVKIAK